MSRAPRTGGDGFRLRALFLFAVLLLGAAGLLARAVDLQLVEYKFLVNQGDARFLRDVTTVANRGSILDRNGAPLAISTPVSSVWTNPAELETVPSQWADLAKALHRNRADLTRRISSNQSRSFLWLARHLPPDDAQAVRKLNLPGVHLTREYKRYYPSGEVVGHVLGFTNVDDEGQEGAELAFDHWLAGEEGLKRVIQDRMGRKVEDVESIRAMREGRDLTLSLDMRIQYLAYRELKAAITQNRAHSGSMVVIDVTTGEVLAMVNQPAFNPNDRGQITPAMYRNRAATDIIEPGSAIKPFVVAAALESGRFDTGSVFDTSPIQVGSKIIEEEHVLGTIGLAEVLARSSNVGMTKIALALEPQQLWGTLTKLGFGHVTASGFPGESAGVLSNYGSWRPVGVSSLSRGYGLSVTPLQLAQAYAAIGAHGVMRPVSMLRVDGDVSGERVLSEHTARTLISLLESVVTEGTGAKAAIAGYRVAGKTGTAWKNDGRSYYEDRYTAVFGGMAPATHPRLAAVVVVDDPAAGKYYGGDISAPVFSAVVGGALRMLGVAPDAPGTATDPLTGVTTVVKR
ncbi:MAG TPA: penicillin-binding transpeptidase domain-containing protein [Steroidobacteraceae bacterium]|nr:penicillin-binding transpeptidase domain-containing protein [Steroidobacteraceae bacterium]